MGNKGVGAVTQYRAGEDGIRAFIQHMGGNAWSSGDVLICRIEMRGYRVSFLLQERCQGLHGIPVVDELGIIDDQDRQQVP